MGDKWEPPKLSQTHVFRHGHIFSQICLKSCERRYLKREKFEKILDIEKFFYYANEWEKKNHKFNTVKNQVSWKLIKNNTNVRAHKQCKGTFLKNDYLDKQINTTFIQNDKSDEIHSEVANTPEATKISVKIQNARKKYRSVSSWKNKDLMKCIICDEQKRKKGCPLPLANISLTEKEEKTLREYSELHIKNNNVKYIDGANRILLVLNTKSLLAADVAYQSSGYKLHKTCDEKQKFTKNDEVAWHDFLQIVKIHIIIRGEAHFVTDLRKIYDEIRSERNL